MRLKKEQGNKAQNDEKGTRYIHLFSFFSFYTAYDAHILNKQAFVFIEASSFVLLLLLLLPVVGDNVAAKHVINRFRVHEIICQAIVIY